ncbi:glycoside hydrolase family 16 protein [Pleurotus eryngii]|uniref:Glycoside hydrolase family 16 protein n=1 Tax=Pleurotus eryngii TaxID=5323 RepID=A0A9P6A0L7_PLEER|nr:glycoside hydrolase family 16 protein [Pleurotus eryngii]
MANSSRRVPVPHPGPQDYAAVPTSPRSVMNNNSSNNNYYANANYAQQLPSQTPSRTPSRTPSSGSRKVRSGRGAIAHGVASGQIGGGYGPYSYTPAPSANSGVYTASRFSAPPSDATIAHNAGEKQTILPTTTTVPQYLWDRDPDVDDDLHNPDPVRDARENRSFTIFSGRGWLNAIAIFVLVTGLIVLFAGYPIISYVNKSTFAPGGFNIGGINGTGQIPVLPGLPKLIDDDTPQNVRSRTGSDGKRYNLVFSDEFNTDGRTFYPGDDPFWEAVDLHYWPTGDLEWYDPSAITTEDGKLVITMSQKPSHDLNFESGMLQSWNKFCFTTGYIEVSMSMPGSPKAPGLWPAAWTLGNLGRAGYGATTEGTWPYSYAACDVGTFPNQTARDGTPEAAATGSQGNTELSFLPGQRLSACTCTGSDHPGPRTDVGRAAPEIDIIETQIDTNLWRGEVSQTFQVAPFNYKSVFDNTEPASVIHGSDTHYNSYAGGEFQQAVSALTYIDDQFYNNTAYAPYAFEYWSNPNRRDEGYITWYSNGEQTWTATAAATGPDPISQVSARIIPEEPMYIILNLGLAPNFQKQDFKNLQFPSKMYVDYVRVYQRDDVKNGVTCNPPSRPTADYIDNHINAFSNPNLTTWRDAGYTFPRNSLYDGC